MPNVELKLDDMEVYARKFAVLAEIHIIRMELGQLLEIGVALKDKFNICLDLKILQIKGQDYIDWRTAPNSDEFITNFATTKMQLKVVT